mgnify:CR=1 FL=1
MITYNGVDLSDYLIVNEIMRPIMPSQSLYTKEIYGRRGVYFFDKQDEPLEIPVDVTIKEASWQSYRSLVKEIAGILNVSEPKETIFSDEPDRYVEGIVQGATELEDVLYAGQGTITFFCPDPYYYAIEDEVFTHAGEGTRDFTREKGNTESFPLIEIQGSNSGGIITLETDNTKIEFDGELAEGEILVFDSDFITAYIEQADGERRSAINDIDTIDFPYFSVGANQVSVTTTGSATINEFTIYCRSCWK